MLIDFTVSNFKSIKNKQTFSLIASTMKMNDVNVIKNPNIKDVKFNLLNSAVIYGANGSGKSNLISAIKILKDFVLNSTDAKLNEEIKYYFPYKLDLENKTKPIVFEIEFININKIRYRYFVSYNRFEILKEKLFYYPKGQEAKLFDRKPNNKIEYGESLKGEKKIIEKQLLKNVLFLSKGANSNNKQLAKVYEFFQLSNLCVIQGSFQYDIPFDINHGIITTNLLENYLNFFDTGIKKVVFKKDESRENNNIILSLLEVSKNNSNVSEVQSKIINELKYKPEFIHDVYSDGKKIGTETFKLFEESIGTQKLYKILGIVYKILDEGGILILDEINNSFHTLLTKLLIELFQKENTNKKNAQLILTTHDTNIFGYKLFRRDQIWFADKDKFGATSLYSLIEFKNNNLRKDTPLETRYLSGRFGALPIFNDLNLFKQVGEE